MNRAASRGAGAAASRPKRGPTLRQWLVDITVGGVIGGIVGGIAAVNVVIYSGVDRGYQASITEVFEYSPLVGIATLLILVAGPMLGVVVARRVRRQREGAG